MLFHFYNNRLRIYIHSGGIELNNLDMNVEVIQDYLSQVAPFIQIEKATVKQLRVTVCFFLFMIFVILIILFSTQDEPDLMTHFETRNSFNLTFNVQKFLSLFLLCLLLFSSLLFLSPLLFP